MIIRRLSDGIRRQDWFTVVVEVVIVVVGVYVGIYIGDAANDRAEQKDITATLKVLQTQLEADLENVDKIHDYRVKRFDLNADIIKFLSSPIKDKQKLTETLHSGGGYFTFFPNMSAFQSMRNQGYLAKISDPDLKFELANLYDSIYERLKVNSKQSDDASSFYWLENQNVYWDSIKHDFIGDPTIAKSRIQNGIKGVMRFSALYIDLLKGTIRPELIKSIASLKSHLEKNGNN